MVDLNGQKLKTNQEKADPFAKTFVKKTEEVVSNVKLKKMKSTMVREKFFKHMKRTG